MYLGWFCPAFSWQMSHISTSFKPAERDMREWICTPAAQTLLKKGDHCTSAAWNWPILQHIGALRIPTNSPFMAIATLYSSAMIHLGTTSHDRPVFYLRSSLFQMVFCSLLRFFCSYLSVKADGDSLFFGTGRLAKITLIDVCQLSQHKKEHNLETFYISTHWSWWTFNPRIFSHWTFILKIISWKHSKVNIFLTKLLYLFWFGAA